MLAADILLADYELCCAAGSGMAEIRKAIAQQSSGLRPNNIAHSDLPTWIGNVEALDSVQWKSDEQQWLSRNNALISHGLMQGTIKASIAAAVSAVGNDRVGIIFGSSTSSIDRSEEAYRQLTNDGGLKPEFQQEHVLNPHSPGLYLAHTLGLKGPNMTINTACSSSAKVFASAYRWLKLGIVDAVVVGGADSLGLSVLHGFNSLQLVSQSPCKPFDQNRDGINLGEAAGFALLVRSDFDIPHKSVKLSAYGESSDAHHMSHPHPEGAGAKQAIEHALNMAQLKPEDIGYINLHGTASRANDLIEGQLISKMFDQNTYASSTKGWTGHTLGAAGITESILAIDTMNTGVIPGTLNLEQLDPEIPLHLSNRNQQGQPKHVMSNSFGFGGNNACLIFSQYQA